MWSFSEIVTFINVHGSVPKLTLIKNDKKNPIKKIPSIIVLNLFIKPGCVKYCLNLLLILITNLRKNAIHPF